MKVFAMLPEPPIITVPIRMDEHGDIRVSGTRVMLDVIIARFHQGYSPESIHEAFDSVPLTDVYAVIAYYLTHRDELDAYIKKRDEEADQLRKEIEANYTPAQRDFQERVAKIIDEKRRQSVE